MYEEHDEVIALLHEAIPSGNNWLRANCPFCPGIIGKVDKRRSFGFQQESGYYHCFRCGTAGKIPESDQWAPIDGTEVKAPGDDTDIVMDPPEGFIPLWKGDGLTARATHEARSYLLERGLDSSIIEGAKIGACISGEFASRVVVPIIAVDGETWLGYSARDWTNLSDLRYRYPKGMPRSTIMYEHRVLHETTEEPAIIVEGVFDALPYFGRSVAVLGKPSPWQAAALAEAQRPVAIAFDGDAWQLGWALAQKLQLAGVRAGSIRLPAGEDPNSVDRNWLLDEAARCVA